MLLIKSLDRQDLQKTKKGFNAWTPFYFRIRNWVYGKSIATIQEAFLDDLPKNQNHLIIGDGNADIANALLRFANPTHCHLVDASPRMLEHAKRQLTALNCCTFEVKSLQHFKSYSNVDVLHLPFVLDLLSDEEIIELSEKWYSRLPETAHIHIIDFNAERNRFHQKLLYTIFKITTGTNRKTLPKLTHLLSAKWAPTQSLKSGRFKAMILKKQRQIDQ